MIFLDLFNIMENHNSNIQNIRFSVSMLPRITDFFFPKRNYATHVKTLVLDHSKIGNFDLLKRLTCLKNLTVYSKPCISNRPDININQLLYATVSLESPTLYCATIECDEPVSTKPYSLKKLSITRSCFPASLSSSSKKISSLKFDLCHNFRNNVINLPRLNLAYFEYRSYWKSSNNERYILIHILKNDEKRYWTTTRSYAFDDKFEGTFIIRDATLYDSRCLLILQYRIRIHYLLWSVVWYPKIALLTPMYC